jgi:hypothetical protein
MAGWLTTAGFRVLELRTAFEIEREGRGGLWKYPVFVAFARRS